LERDETRLCMYARRLASFCRTSEQASGHVRDWPNINGHLLFCFGNAHSDMLYPLASIAQSMIMTLDQIPRRNPSALLEDLHLLRDLAQPPNHLLVAPRKAINRVRDADVLAEGAHHRLRLAQVMPRDARVQVVHGLELQAAVHEVEPGGTVDVHGGAQHLLRERLVHAEVRGRHGEVAEGDLHVERGGDHVRDEDEGEAGGPGGDAQVERLVAEPVPEEQVAGDLEVAVPPGGAFAWRLGGAEEVGPAEDVEVEAAEGEDRVVQPVLVADGPLGDGVEGHEAVVVG